MSTPAGPYEMNPIISEEQANYNDFRPKPGEPTAFQQYMEKTAFSEEQRAKHDAEADADELFGTDGEPKTAFELEMRGGRAPLDAQESAPDSPVEPEREDSKPEPSGPPVTAEKGKPSPTPPKVPQAS